MGVLAGSFSPLPSTLTFCATLKKKKKEKNDPVLHPSPPLLFSRSPQSESAQTPLVAAESLNLISGTMCERFAKFEP